MLDKADYEIREKEFAAMRKVEEERTEMMKKMASLGTSVPPMHVGPPPLKEGEIYKLRERVNSLEQHMTSLMDMIEMLNARLGDVESERDVD